MITPGNADQPMGITKQQAFVQPSAVRRVARANAHKRQYCGRRFVAENPPAITLQRQG
jgi:hypothetical protein